ncbi:MAG: hypothetical protein QNJ41_27530 [Xenococcaceae cyanobacterium MO_188.B32]|nr:hypothetical protein [Xenococcaceae cyanobacterium MO_188.B32]
MRKLTQNNLWEFSERLFLSHFSLGDRRLRERKRSPDSLSLSGMRWCVTLLE